MQNKIFTIIEARVEQGKWDILKEEYEKVENGSLPDTLLSSHLMQDTKEPEVWRIVTIWQSLEAITAYRASVETPAWILVFQKAGSEPKLIINEIILSK